MPASSFPGPGFDAVIFDTDGFVTNVQVLRLLALRPAAWRRSPTARPDRMRSGPPGQAPGPGTRRRVGFRWAPDCMSRIAKHAGHSVDPGLAGHHRAALGALQIPA
jgi:hypothetical protein